MPNEKDGIIGNSSRRGFLKGSLAVGVVGIAAPAIAVAAPAAEKHGEAEPDFLKAPEPIPDSKIVETWEACPDGATWDEFWS